ncbi:hypothetical protein [Pararobbsia silviterrae]|uniref:Uncharacterized protein n=1 Tax=Pararobbsia silviterrae TaxID=1792498 RepID=A0A494XA54_9BURK|nr:hypothetical protein [Pararobbsia silviterrae]RKP44994.1 hypothetical protein D7S86_26515 [Pararobbsia silviterrae]
MSNDDDGFLTRLIPSILGHLRQIARGTRGEHSVDDLKAEAWLVAREIQDESQQTLDPDDESFREAVIRRLRKAFGQFVDRPFRFAFRLDEEDQGDDGEIQSNRIASTLAAPKQYEPEHACELVDQYHDDERTLRSRFTEAVAYLRSLEFFSGNGERLASHLAISKSMLFQRMARAEHIARMQPSLFDGVEEIPSTFVAKPARRRSPSPKRSLWRALCHAATYVQAQLFSLFSRLW